VLTAIGEGIAEILFAVIPTSPSIESTAAAEAESVLNAGAPLFFGCGGSADGGKSKVGKHTMRSSMYLQGPCPACRPNRTKVVARLLWAPQLRTCTGLTAMG
jgi:hypothetical protein